MTDEFAAVKVVASGDPVLTFPNEITDSTWKGWVQERGLYFDWLIAIRVPRRRRPRGSVPYNKGEKRGALVQTTHGKGNWVYVGLGLWRQLPTGTDDAYQLLANLISLGKAPTAAKAPVPAKPSVTGRKPARP